MLVIVSLLDKKSDRIVRSLWKQLERTFGLRLGYATPLPHFSYQVASNADMAKLESRLGRFASLARKFNVHAGGLGVFTGFTPVVYIPIVRTLKLSRFHESLWKTISPNGSSILPYYKPDFWMPHITLARTHVDERKLAKAVGSLSRQDLELDVMIDNLAIILDNGTDQIVRSRYRLR